MADPKANDDAGGPFFRVSGHGAFDDDTFLELLAEVLIEYSRIKNADPKSGVSSISRPATKEVNRRAL